MFKLSARLLVIALALPATAWAQHDMMGFDLMALLAVVPQLILHALTEFAVALVVMAVVMLVAGWLIAKLRRSAESPRNRLPLVLGGAAVILLIALAATALMPDRAHRSGPKVAALVAPNGKPWPKKTGYLDMPQSAPSGTNAVRITHGSSAGRVYVKLCVAGQAACPGLRHALIEKFGEFQFQGLADGSYEIRVISIDRPTIAGKSRIIAVSTSSTTPVVRLPFQPMLDSREYVYGIKADAF